jgi:inorganic pyrophosphatase
MRRAADRRAETLTAATVSPRTFKEDPAMNRPAGPVLPLESLDAVDADSGLVNAVVETPRGSRCKYKYDATAGLGRTVRNDRLVGVVETPYNPPEVRTLDELGDERLGEVEHFFVAYNDAEGKHFRPVGRHGPDRAERLIEDGRRRAAEASKNETRRGTASPAPKR